MAEATTLNPMKEYQHPLSIFFIWHPQDKDRVLPVFQECFNCLRRNVDRPFSRSASIPVFFRTCAEGGVPSGIIAKSKRTMIIPFIGKNCMGEDGWGKYLESLFEVDGFNFVPIALDNTAFNFCKCNFIRSFEFPNEVFLQRVCIDIFHEIYRYGLNEKREILNHGKDSALKLFLSHAKDGAQGLTTASALKNLIDSGSMRNFFDATDIAAGYKFEDEILNHINDSTLVSIHSDSYSSRYWCQREILAAKDCDRPILIVDVIGEVEDRRFPLAANVPVLRIPIIGNQIGEMYLFSILKTTLLETIRFFYSKQALTEYQYAGWFPPKAYLSARPPEACVLARLSSQTEGNADGCLDFIYPDPPIYPEESKHFEKFGLNIYTPLTNISLDLSTKKVGVSISEPSSLELLEIGQTDQHLKLLLQDIARYVLCYKAELIYGGDLRPGGFTEFLFQEGHALQNRLKHLKVHLTNHIAWPIYLSDTAELKNWKATHRNVAKMVEHTMPSDVNDLVASATEFLYPSDSKSSFIWSRSLAEMRKAMIATCDIRISAGGRLSGYNGWMPGVLEEIAIAATMNKPMFLLGGFGGVTQSVCQMIVEQAVPEELTLEWQITNNPKLGELLDFAKSRSVDYKLQYEQDLEIVMKSEFRNGLSHEENKTLFESSFSDEIINLILKGIKAL